MDIRYYKEQQRSYMTIRQTEDEEQVRFQRKMLKSRKMGGILTPGSRIADGEKYNYYDITSRTSLKQLFATRQIDHEELHKLLCGLKEALAEADRYMIDPLRIAVDPELIFYGYREKSFFFLPNLAVSPEENGEGLPILMDFLLDRVDPDDEKAQNIVYNLYERYERGGFDIWDICACAEDTEYGSEDIRKREEDEPGTGEYDPVTYSNGEAGKAAAPPDIDDASFANAGSGYGEVTSSGEGRFAGKNDKIPYFIMFGIGILGMAVCAAIFFCFSLEPDEETILLAAAGAMLVIASIGTFLIIRKTVSDRKREQEEADRQHGEWPGINGPQVHMEDFVDVPESPSRIASGRNTGKRSDREAGSTDTCPKERADEYPEESGQTVFFDGKSSAGLKLYALDRKNKKHIDLDRLPVTVGKMKGYVDMCLDHPSVSRMHAKLYNDGERLMLEDLNSTNGVFINGIRLMPNESREIEEGDEIRFGALSYSLRSCG